MYLKNNQKSADVRVIIEEAIDIISVMGVPILEQTERRKERMAMAFLAIAGVTSSWQEAQLEEKRTLKTRDIISFINEHFEENISSGSYDDIRRKD